MDKKKKVLADTYYATSYLNGICTSLNEEIERQCPSWIGRLASHSGLVRGVLFFWLGRSYKTIVTAVHHPGWSVVVILETLISREKKIVLLEFLMGRPTVYWRQFVHSLWLKYLIKPSLRRVLRSAQVLTTWERQHYAQQYGIPVDRFCFIPYFLREQSDSLPDCSSSTNLIVMSSGRAACDWETLFAAAVDANWPLIIVCRKRDYRIVTKLNTNNHAKILVDISSDEHARYLRSAAVYVVTLMEVGASTGHVRIKNAIRLGIPIVATAVKGIDGYLFDGENALLVAPGDPVGLRIAIEKLLADPDYRTLLSRKAFELAAEQTRDNYRVKIRELVERSYEIQHAN